VMISPPATTSKLYDWRILLPTNQLIRSVSSFPPQDVLHLALRSTHTL
jgi:hypothetical protein